MNKKFLSLVLALVMVLGTFGSVFAETKAPEAKDAKKSEVKVPEKKETNEKVQWLVDNEIVVGRKVNKDDKNADLALDKDIQRAEVTKLLIYAIGQQDLAARLNGVYAPYSDVPANHWANGLIAAGSTVASPANALPFLHGIGHNMFQPERQVRYDELAKMLVVLVKKDLTKDGLAAAKWPTDWMNWAAQLGIFDGINTPVDGSKPAVRQDAFVMLYNALYKLGDLVAYPSHETMGIISDATFNKFTVNQGDLKKEFTVNANTNFVPSKYTKVDGKPEYISWSNVYGNEKEYYIGSLVRVLADDKGNVTHIIQLGNPAELAKEGNGWEAVASHVAETKDVVALGTVSEFKLSNANVYDLKNKLADKEVTVKTTDSTRYFVADNKNEVLTEVKDKAALLALFDRAKLDVKNGVYVGYNVLPNAKVNEAKVVVVHDVDTSNISSDIVRISTPGTFNYVLKAQKPGYTPTKVEKFDLRNYKAAFPANYGFDGEDVVDLGSKSGDILINRSEDPVYKILEVKTQPAVKDNYLTGKTSRVTTLKIADKGNGIGYVDLREDTKVFFGNQLKENAKIQLHFEKGYNNLVDVVSVLAENTPLKGFLPEKVKNVEDAREVKAEFISATELGKTGRYTVKVYLIENGTKARTATTFELRNEGVDLTKLVPGQEITFNDLGVKGASNLPLIGDLKGADVKADAKAEIAKLTDLEAAEKTAAEGKVDAAATKADVDKAVQDAKDLNDVNTVLKATTKVVLPKGSTIDEATVKANLPKNEKGVKVEATKVDSGAKTADLKFTKGDASKPATGVTVVVAK